MVDILASTKLDDNDILVEEPPQPNRGNKISKKNKKKNKNKNQQDWDGDSAGIHLFYLFVAHKMLPF